MTSLEPGPIGKENGPEHKEAALKGTKSQMDDKPDKDENRESEMPVTLSDEEIEEAIQAWFDRGDEVDKRHLGVPH